jgi:endoglucanase
MTRPALALLFAAALVLPVVAQDRTVTLLQQLTDAAGPPGFEEPIRKILVDLMKPLSSTLTFDGLGSIIATQGTQGPRVMVDAHMDELGGMTRRVTPLAADDADARWLAGSGARRSALDHRSMTGALTGIRDVHVVPADYARAFIHATARSSTWARRAGKWQGASAGRSVVPDAPLTVLNGTDNYLAKGWDDRVGCGVVVEAMRRLATVPHPNQIVWTITTQEEVGLRGAESAAAVVKPELALAIEGGITGDIFPGRAEETQARLGAGPGIFLYDSSALPNRKLTALVKQTAAEKKLPLQTDLVQGYGDDSAELQRSNGGVPTINMIVPIRYTHAHNGIMNRRDFDQMVDLLVALLQKLDAPTVAKVRDFTPQ